MLRRSVGCESTCRKPAHGREPRPATPTFATSHARANHTLTTPNRPFLPSLLSFGWCSVRGAMGLLDLLHRGTTTRTCGYVRCRKPLPADAAASRLYCDQACRKRQWLLNHPGALRGSQNAAERLRRRLRPRLPFTVARVDGDWVVVRWSGTVVERFDRRREARERANELRGPVRAAKLGPSPTDEQLDTERKAA
jgi:hypothetical protein